jgi:hypothetical protein
VLVTFRSHSPHPPRPPLCQLPALRERGQSLRASCCRLPQAQCRLWFRGETDTEVLSSQEHPLPALKGNSSKTQPVPDVWSPGSLVTTEGPLPFPASPGRHHGSPTARKASREHPVPLHLLRAQYSLHFHHSTPPNFSHHLPVGSGDFLFLQRQTL